jgi:hypothetical protein
MEIKSRFVSVDKAVAQLIAAWPTLFSTREDALLRFAGQGWSEKTGEPLREDSSDQDLNKTFEQLMADQVGHRPAHDRTDFMRSFDNRMVLDRLREQNDALFTRANAELIASLEGDFKSPPRLSTYDVNRWPANMTPAWKAAMVELADRILEYPESKVEKHTDSPVSRGQYLAGLKEAKEAAKEILARFAPERATQAEKQERDAAIQKLRYAAEKLGYSLTPMKA